MSTDWNAFGDRNYIKISDICVVFDFIAGAGVNTPSYVFGGPDWIPGYASLSAKTTITDGRALSVYSTSSSGSAILARIDSTTADFAAFWYNGINQVGSVSTNGTATSYNTTSDYRLKKNFRPIEGAIATFKMLRPGTFEWTATGKTTDGFLAHEFGKVIPGACHGKKDAVDKDGNIIPQGIDQSKAVPLLVAALQEAISRIEALEDAAPPA